VEYDAYRSAELAELYDAVYADGPDIDFWLSLLGSGADPILELGCGTGRVLLPLARSGHDVTGIDLAPHMVARCVALLGDEPPEVRERVTVAQADMTSFELDRTFASAICAFGTFHHLRTADEQLACLNSCRRHLKPGGTLILDLINPDPAPLEPAVNPLSADLAADDAAADRTVAWSEGRRIRSWASVVASQRTLQCNDVEATYEILEADGTVRRVTETFPMRFVFRYELEHLLARCGYRVLSLYGDYDRSAFGDDSPGMIVVAQVQDR